MPPRQDRHSARDIGDLLDFSFLLLAAGNETTRELIARGTLALIAHPDQCRLVAENPALVPGAVEEMLRWTSPVVHMARTATADVEIRGQRIAEGDMVVMLYGSANRDEDVFGSDSEEFKVTRHPNPHRFRLRRTCLCRCAIGTRGGVAVFGELLRRFPRLELAGEVDRMPATVLPLVTRMPVRLGG